MIRPLIADRHAEERAHRRVFGWEAGARRVGADVGNAERATLGDDQPEEPVALGQRAETPSLLGRDAARDEALDAPSVVDDAERRVLRADQAADAIDDELQDGLDVELAGDGADRVAERLERGAGGGARGCRPCGDGTSAAVTPKRSGGLGPTGRPEAGRTTSTGQGALRTTYSETEPRSRRPIVPRPCVPTTTRSTLSASAAETIDSPGSPVQTRNETVTPMARPRATSAWAASWRRSRTWSQRIADDRRRCWCRSRDR